MSRTRVRLRDLRGLRLILRVQMYKHAGITLCPLRRIPVEIKDERIVLKARVHSHDLNRPPLRPTSMRILACLAALLMVAALAGCDGCEDNPYAAPSDGAATESY